MSEMRVAVDARPLSHPQPGGFCTYIRALLRGIGERHAAGFPVPRLLLYIDRPLSGGVLATLPPGSETRLLSPSRLRTDWQLWNRQVRADAPDIVFGTQNYLPPASPVPTVITLHDAMGIKQYEWDKHTPRTPRERFINRYWHYLTAAANKRSRRVLTVSHGSLAEIRTVLTSLPESRFVVVYNGVALPLPKTPIKRDANTLLCLASPDSRKNLLLLYRALEEHGERFGLPIPTLRIVCTSPTTASRTEAVLQKHGLQAELLRGLDDAALAEAYARATVFVWPSRLEGFGMPPLEMMLTGGAVAASSAVCMPELLGDTPAYFAPDDTEGLADATRLLLQDHAGREERGKRGRERAASFTCRRMADETIAAWEAAS